MAFPPHGEIPVVQALPTNNFDLRRLILKLRWIGLDEEAHRLTRVMNDRGPESSPFVGPFDTD